MEFRKKIVFASTLKTFSTISIFFLIAKYYIRKMKQKTKKNICAKKLNRLGNNESKITGSI